MQLSLGSEQGKHMCQFYHLEENSAGQGLLGDRERGIWRAGNGSGADASEDGPSTEWVIPLRGGNPRGLHRSHPRPELEHAVQGLPRFSHLSCLLPNSTLGRFLPP